MWNDTWMGRSADREDRRWCPGSVLDSFVDAESGRDDEMMWPVRRKTRTKSSDSTLHHYDIDYCADQDYGDCGDDDGDDDVLAECVSDARSRGRGQWEAGVHHLLRPRHRCGNCFCPDVQMNQMKAYPLCEPKLSLLLALTRRSDAASGEEPANGILWAAEHRTKKG